MTPETNIREYAAEQVSRLLGRLVSEVHRAARDKDPETIHDLRVSIRRFSQGLRVFGQFFPRREARKIRRRVKQIIEAAAAVRDRDIALELCARAGLEENAALAGRFRADRRLAEIEFLELVQALDGVEYSSQWRRALGLVTE